MTRKLIKTSIKLEAFYITFYIDIKVVHIHE